MQTNPRPKKAACAASAATSGGVQTIGETFKKLKSENKIKNTSWSVDVSSVFYQNKVWFVVKIFKQLPRKNISQLKHKYGNSTYY